MDRSVLFYLFLLKWMVVSLNLAVAKAYVPSLVGGYYGMDTWEFLFADYSMWYSDRRALRLNNW
jgi:hypothetical protein